MQPIIGAKYQLRSSPELGDYSGSTVVVETGPRNEGSEEQYRVAWGSGVCDVDWIHTTMFEGCRLIG